MSNMKQKITKAKSKRRDKNVPLSIEDHPIKNFVFGQEVVTEPQEIQQVSVDKQQRLREHAETVLKPYQFLPGESGNPSGRPPDLVKGIAMRMGQLKAGAILSEKELDKLKKLGLATADITVIESIVLDWATSTNPIKQQMYIERVAGKVPNININAEVSAAVVSKFRDKLTDAELERIGAGEDALEILLEKIPDVPDIQYSQGDEEIIDASE